MRAIPNSRAVRQTQGSRHCGRQNGGLVLPQKPGANPRCPVAAVVLGTTVANGNKVDNQLILNREIILVYPI